MTLFVQAMIGGSCGAAIVTGVFALIKAWVDNKLDSKKHKMLRSETLEDSENVQNKALRYIMLYIIQERAKELISQGYVTVDDRRSLHAWHDLYHNELKGNGDASALMGAVDRLELKVN